MMNITLKQSQRKRPGVLARVRKAVAAFVVNSLDCIAPYTVHNVRFGKMHYCWTYATALAWLACYDANEFGASFVSDFNGEIVGAVGI